LDTRNNPEKLVTLDTRNNPEKLVTLNTRNNPEKHWTQEEDEDKIKTFPIQFFFIDVNY
jgi:hypothetical protein